VLVECDEPADALALWHRLSVDPLEDVHEVVPGALTVLVVGRIAAPTRELLLTLPGLPFSHAAAGSAVVIPVRYDGLDLASVAATAGLTPDEVVERHCAAVYVVAFGGFVPGFAYLTGLDPALRVPRHATPRARVSAGSVAIAEQYAGVYPRDGPGGWQVLGSTDAVMFDPRREPVALLATGSSVRFEPAG
jgi:KipI family sensor histidine kinase inhibitor